VAFASSPPPGFGRIIERLGDPAESS